MERHHRRFRGKQKRRQSYDKGGEGTEIVQELMVCPECAKQHDPASDGQSVLVNAQS